jgi:hypothetical protein
MSYHLDQLNRGLVMELVEASEAMAMWVANVIESFSVYLTVTFAYLTVAYLAGKKLSGFQVLVISVLYTSAAGISLLSCINQLIFYTAIANEIDSAIAAVPLISGETWIYAISPLLIVGVLVSLLFMWNVRHPKRE